MYMITVCNIIFIGDSLYHPESLLQALGELVGGRLHRRSIYGVADILRFLPLLAFIVQPLHNLQGKWPGLRICMRLAHHAHAHLI